MPDTSAPTSLPSDVLLDYLRDRHLPCPVCRQDLYQLSTPRCPHCRNELSLGLATTGSYRIAWGILLAALFPASGVGLLLAIVCGRAGGGIRSEFILPFTLFFAAIPLPILPVIARRRFFKLPSHSQYVWAAAGLALTASLFLLLFLRMRR